MNIQQARRQAGSEIVDFILLKSILAGYAHPRKKISSWLSKGELIRVKKGLYVFGEEAQLMPYSIEILANLIYGPSAISMEYALSYYGLIPERVHTVTSITSRRDKKFITPVGEFTYRYLNHKKYSVGIQLLAIHETSFLMATPEKAICDFIMFRIKDVEIQSVQDFEEFVFSDLRMNEEQFKCLDPLLLVNISRVYKNKRVNQFVNQYLVWNQ